MVCDSELASRNPQRANRFLRSIQVTNEVKRSAWSNVTLDNLALLEGSYPPNLEYSEFRSSMYCFISSSSNEALQWSFDSWSRLTLNWVHFWLPEYLTISYDKSPLGETEEICTQSNPLLFLLFPNNIWVVHLVYDLSPHE